MIKDILPVSVTHWLISDINTIRLHPDRNIPLEVFTVAFLILPLLCILLAHSRIHLDKHLYSKAAISTIAAGFVVRETLVRLWGVFNYSGNGNTNQGLISFLESSEVNALMYLGVLACVVWYFYKHNLIVVTAKPCPVKFAKKKVVITVK